MIPAVGGRGGRYSSRSEDGAQQNVPPSGAGSAESGTSRAKRALEVEDGGEARLAGRVRGGRGVLAGQPVERGPADVAGDGELLRRAEGEPGAPFDVDLAPAVVLRRVDRVGPAAGQEVRRKLAARQPGVDRRAQAGLLARVPLVFG